MDEPAPRPAIDCADPANAGKPACAPQNDAMTDDQIYEKAYWSAKTGAYADALAVAAQAQNANDPRILRVKGFATRKMGDVDAAMPFYRKALSIDPGDTRTRQYMGEAYPATGRFAECARAAARNRRSAVASVARIIRSSPTRLRTMHVRLPRSS